MTPKPDFNIWPEPVGRIYYKTCPDCGQLIEARNPAQLQERLANHTEGNAS